MCTRCKVKEKRSRGPGNNGLCAKCSRHLNCVDNEFRENFGPLPPQNQVNLPANAPLINQPINLDPVQVPTPGRPKMDHPAQKTQSNIISQDISQIRDALTQLKLRSKVTIHLSLQFKDTTREKKISISGDIIDAVDIDEETLNCEAATLVAWKSKHCISESATQELLDRNLGINHKIKGYRVKNTEKGIRMRMRNKCK